MQFFNLGVLLTKCFVSYGKLVPEITHGHVLAMYDNLELLELIFIVLNLSDVLI